MVLFLMAMMGLSSSLTGKEFMSVEEAVEYPGFVFQGEYVGIVEIEVGEDPIKAGLQVSVHEGNLLRGKFYHGGLPGDLSSWAPGDDVVDLEGVHQDQEMELAGSGPLRIRGTSERLTVWDEGNNYRGRLDPVRRKSPTLGLLPPKEAVVLFDGSNLDHWREGASMTDEGLLIQGARSAVDFGDMRLHVEAKLAFMPHAEGEARGNSGIYIQNRYEVQILDSFAMPATEVGNASLYREHAPLVNASYPPLTWQTYDVFFRAPRFGENGEKTENARVTAYLNGVLVQDDVELEKGTGAGGRRPEVAVAELFLQDHGEPARFQNVWLIEEEYSPPGTNFLIK